MSVRVATGAGRVPGHWQSLARFSTYQVAMLCPPQTPPDSGLEVGNKSPIGCLTFVTVLDAQECRWMNRDEKSCAVHHINWIAHSADAQRLTHQTPRGGSASATIVDGLIKPRSMSIQTLQRSIS